MGWQTEGQGMLFYGFDRDAVIPEDHLVGGSRSFVSSRSLRVGFGKITKTVHYVAHTFGPARARASSTL
jgi:hypothetical protein